MHSVIIHVPSHLTSRRLLEDVTPAKQGKDGIVSLQRIRLTLVQILYGVPVPQSSIPRLLHLASLLHRGSVSVMIDNLDAFQKFHSSLWKSELEIGVFIKIDTGYHRAGIQASSPSFAELVGAVLSQSGKSMVFKGFYSHYGHSYAGNTQDDAAVGLIAELVGLQEAVSFVPPSHTGRVVLSVGATPTATAAQNMLSVSSPKAKEFMDVLGRLKKKYDIELHAGVYPLLDCQQVATHARPASNPTKNFQPLSKDNIAIRMLVEVTSIYNERGKPEALVSAGSLAMGREPCKSYPGWGIVTSDLGNSMTESVYDER